MANSQLLYPTIPKFHSANPYMYPNIGGCMQNQPVHTPSSIKEQDNLYANKQIKPQDGEIVFIPGKGVRQIKDKIVEVPMVRYREVPVEKIVEVPEIQTQIVEKEVEIPITVEVPVIHPRKVPVEQSITRNIPKPIEIRVSQGYEIPKLKPVYKEIPVPIYVPRYIEVPVPAQFVNSVQGSKPVARSITQTSYTNTVLDESLSGNRDSITSPSRKISGNARSVASQYEAQSRESQLSEGGPQQTDSPSRIYSTHEVN